MSKIEVIGPRDLLLQVLGTIQRSAALQVDPEIQVRMRTGAEARLKRLSIDASTIAERLFFDDLKLKVERLLALLPAAPDTTAGVKPDLSVPDGIPSLASTIDAHTAHIDERARRLQALAAEIDQLTRYRGFLAAVERLVPPGSEAAGLDLIAVEVKDDAAVHRLAAAASRLHAGLHTTRTDEGSFIGLLTTEKPLSDRLKEALRDDRIPEAAVPTFLEGLTLTDKIKATGERIATLQAEAGVVDDELGTFARLWRGRYEQAHQWLQNRLALLTTSAQAYETNACFVVFGWTPSAHVEPLKRELASRYGGRVIVDEKEILDQDLELVPVTLRNRGYFRPFELLVSWLPLPKYSSFDPTTFVAIFFPIIFGMILGDVGYGVVLLAGAIGLIVRAGDRTAIDQAGKILGVAAVYSIIFGVLYGECFGEAGAHALGLPAPYIDRRGSLVPMLYFSVAVGTAHVLVGLSLGLLTALRRRKTREAAARLTGMAALLCLAGIAASYLAPVAAMLRGPLIVLGLVLVPLLILTGGILAPFELLRDVGNIISYARIMAVGLASVLLAYVANSLAGAAGSIWVGIAAAVALHVLNIILGIFAPTVHGLRLHYVEFFGKFLEPGGRRFTPLKHGD